jgi:hypothetical protein
MRKKGNDYYSRNRFPTYKEVFEDDPLPQAVMEVDYILESFNLPKKLNSE